MRLNARQYEEQVARLLYEDENPGSRDPLGWILTGRAQSFFPFRMECTAPHWSYVGPGIHNTYLLAARALLSSVGWIRGRSVVYRSHEHLLAANQAPRAACRRKRRRP